MWSNWRFPLQLTAAVIGFMLLVDVVVAPMHERNATVWSALLCGMARWLELPGLFIAESRHSRFRTGTSQADWLIMLVSSVPIYLVAADRLRQAWGSAARSAGGRPTEPIQPVDKPSETAETPSAPRSPDSDASGGISRRQVLQLGRRAALCAAGGCGRVQLSI